MLISENYTTNKRNWSSDIQAYKQKLLPCIETPTKDVTSTAFDMLGTKPV